MAQTIGDVIGRGWNTGRAIGSDFSEWRFKRGEAKLQEEFEQRAAAEGKPLDAYAGEYEQALAELYRRSGAAKRGVRGATGNALNLEALDSFQSRGSRAASREASRMALEGDIGGSRGRLASSSAATGDYAGTIDNLQAQGQIGATSGAIGADGAVDPYKLSSGIATNAARFGDAAGAAGAAETAHQARYTMASGIAGQIVPLLQNPEANVDQIKGLFEGLKQYVPLAQNMDIQPAADGKLAIFQNGQAIGSLDDRDEVMGIIASLQRDPRGTIGAWEQARIASATAQGEYDRENAGAYRDARIALNHEYVKAGGNAADFQSVLSAREKAADAGWKQLSVNQDTGEIMATVNGQLVKIVPGTDPGVPGGERGAGFEIIDSSGQIIDPAQLGANAQPALDFALAVTAANANASDAAATSRLITGLELLNQFETGDTSAPRRQGTAPQDVDAIQQDFRDIGSELGFEITSMERGVLNVGAGARSQHPKGTAVDYRVRGKSPAEIDALIARLQSAGYEVVDERDGTTGTGPHIHAELPPSGAPARSRQVATRTAGSAPALPTAPAAAAAAAPVAPQRAAVVDPREAERLVAAAEERIRRFDEENPMPAPSYGRGTGALQLDRGPRSVARDRLVADYRKAQQAAEQARNALQGRRALALRDQRASEADALYARYAGGDTPGSTADPNFDAELEARLGFR